MIGVDKPKSYTGNGPFIFVSYSHKDSDRVYPDIAALQAQGIAVWYDEGLEPGQPWYEDVARHMAMENCLGTVIYVSEEYLKSDSCWIEVSYVAQGKKAYLSIKLMDTAIKKFVLALRAILTEDENKKIDEEALIKAQGQLLEIFPADITYLEYSAANRLEKIEQTIREKWNYNDTAEYFPCCNVLHNGHITYFPSLAAATPFNYTYFVASNKQHVAASLNGMYGTGDRWKEYSLGMICTGDVDATCGVIVSIAPSQLNRLHDILDSRREKAPGVPLIVNVWSSSTEAAWEALQQVRPAIDAWREQHDICTEDPWCDTADTYFLCQTEAKASRQIQSGDSVLTMEDKLERWRILLSDSAYYEFVMDTLAQDTQTVKGVKWLLSQQLLSEDYNDRYDCERASMEGDHVLVQRYDREAFLVCRFEWEDA